MWFGLALYFNSALLLLATPIFTRLLSSADFGQVVLYSAWAQVITIFATLSLSSGVFNNAMLDFADDVDGYVTAMLGLTLVSALVTIGCFALVVLTWRDFTTLGPTLLAFMSVQICANAAFLFWQARERFQYRYKAVVAIGVIGSIIGVGGAVVLIPHSAGLQVHVRVMLPLLPAMLVGVAVAARLLIKGHRLYNGVYWRYALGFSLTLIPHYGAQALLQQVDRFAVDAYVGRDAVGAYGLAAAVASGITLFWTAINTVWAPWMLRMLKASNQPAVVRLATQLVSAVALTGLMVMLAAPEVVDILAPPSYAQAALVLPWMVTASVAQFAQSICLTVQFFHRRAWQITLASLVASGWAVALNIWLVPRFGVTSAAMIAASTQVLLLLMHAAMLRMTGLAPPVQWLPLGGILLAMVAGSVAMDGDSVPALPTRALLATASLAALCLFGWRVWRKRKGS